MTTMKQATELELAQEEEKAERMLDAWTKAFKAFPTADNLNGVTERLVNYQAAWMNGRKRNP